MIAKLKEFPKTIYPNLIWFIFFLIIPLGIVMTFSILHKGSFGQIEYKLDWSNYARVFNPIYLKIILRSLWLAFYTTTLCLVIAFPFAYFTARSGDLMKKVLLGLVVVPFWTNFVIRIYALKLVLGENGIINRFLQEIHLISSPLQLTDNSFSVGIGMIYNYLPFMILPIYVTLEKLDYTLLDAAYDLGATRFQMATKVLLPLSMPGIITGATFVFIPAFGEFVIPDLMGGSQSMYVGSLITETFLKVRDWPFGSALSSLLVIMAMVSFIFVLTKQNKELADERLMNSKKKQDANSGAALHV